MCQPTTIQNVRKAVGKKHQSRKGNRIGLCLLRCRRYRIQKRRRKFQCVDHGPGSQNGTADIRTQRRNCGITIITACTKYIPSYHRLLTPSHSSALQACANTTQTATQRALPWRVFPNSERARVVLGRICQCLTALKKVRFGLFGVSTPRSSLDCVADRENMGCEVRNLHRDLGQGEGAFEHRRARKGRAARSRLRTITSEDVPRNLSAISSSRVSRQMRSMVGLVFCWAPPSRAPLISSASVEIAR